MNELELREILSILEEVQIASECEGLHGDQVTSLKRYSRSIKFHTALHESNMSDADLACLTESEEQALLGSEALAEIDISRLREKLAKAPVRFTHAEPPSTTATLAFSFARVWRFVQREIPNTQFILATDTRYRPHASVQEWLPDCYLILMGRYFIYDVIVLANILAKYISDVIVDLGNQPWLSEYFGSSFTAAMERCELRYQFAYKLCSCAEGERYRFAVQMPSDPMIDQIANEIATGALDFLVGHELAHVVSGHLCQSTTIPDAFPSWLNQACEVLRANLGKNADNYLTTYQMQFFASHKRELDADSLGLLFAAGDGPTGAWDLRLFGAQIVVCLISFLDRAHHFLEFKKDPVAIIGLQAYNIFGMIDLLLPKESHPWGKTRASHLNSILFSLYHNLFSQAELKRKARLMLLVQETFCRYVPYALGAMQFINSRPGEYVSALMPEGKLWTRYFSATPGVEPVKEDTITLASEFYGTAQKIIW
ncbi:MAG: M48 family metalloprotease [Symploca sp. SIO2E6]|nr:M48 family metalloprotease [Symploca sp. SIO2E6]